MVARRTRQGRPQTAEERLSAMRRRTVVPGGVTKTYSPSIKFRRKTFGGHEGAGPDDMPEQALPELLREAERELIREGTPLRTPQSTRTSLSVPAESQHSTPSKIAASASFNEFKAPQLPPGLRAWSKADWKLLDSCFTDARYELAEMRGADALPDVDEVSFEDVAERFVVLVGGAALVHTFGKDWTR